MFTLLLIPILRQAASCDSFGRTVWGALGTSTVNGTASQGPCSPLRPQAHTRMAAGPCEDGVNAASSLITGLGRGEHPRRAGRLEVSFEEECGFAAEAEAASIVSGEPHRQKPRGLRAGLVATPGPRQRLLEAAR